MAASEPEGVDGELVDRLLEAMNSPDAEDWANLGWFMVYAVGGDELTSVVPDTGKEPNPGSVAAEKRKTHGLVNRDEYFRRMRARLLRLIRSGVREDFLVSALRNELTSHLQRFAQTEAADDRRQATRERLEHIAASPERIAEFRDTLARRDPEALKRSDQEIARDLRRMAESVGPITRAEAEEAWSRVTRWNERREVISDAVIAEWEDRYARRMVQDM